MGSEHHSSKSETKKQRTASTTIQAAVPAQQNIETSFDRFVGNQGLPSISGAVIQPKLKVGPAHDHYEQEADNVANYVMRMPHNFASHSLQPVTRLQNTSVQRMCSKCQKVLDEEKKHHIQRKATTNQGDIPPANRDRTSTEAANGIAALNGSSGQPLSSAERNFFEPRFNTNFSHIRLHTDPVAATTANAIDARAFTFGNHIAFAQGEYRPGEFSGKQLLAHELTHTMQQQDITDTQVQRTTHGPGTLTNCHNWRIPLPPWIAGTIAHGQIDAMLGIPPMAIPRATKALMGTPTPPHGTPYGFADLWQGGAPAVGIAEIKSTATGSAVAQAQAGHYIRRHREWLARSPWTYGDDTTYATIVGGPLNARPLNLLPVTGTAGLPLGPFWGDPLKTLHVEGDNLGGVVYWCTGPGLPFSPLWYPIFRQIMRDLRDEMRNTQQFAEQVLAPIVAHATAAFISLANAIRSAVEWVAEHSLLLAIVLVALFVVAALIVALAGLLAAPESGGTSLAFTFAGVGGMILAIGALVAVIEGPSAGAPAQVAARNLADTFSPDAASRTASGADYERDCDNGGPFPDSPQVARAQTPDPSRAFVASLQPLTNPATVLQGVATSGRTAPTAADRQQLNDAIGMLERAGDSTSAARARQFLSAIDVA